MALINSPPQEPVDQQNGRMMLTAVAQGWRNFFVAIFNILTALTLSGATVDRPLKFLWIGRPYFDVTLGIPIWVQSLQPTVWCDATGAPV